VKAYGEVRLRRDWEATQLVLGSTVVARTACVYACYVLFLLKRLQARARVVGYARGPTKKPYLPISRLVNRDNPPMHSIVTKS
jgi:hypothetical protein